MQRQNLTSCSWFGVKFILCASPLSLGAEEGETDLIFLLSLPVNPAFFTFDFKSLYIMFSTFFFYFNFCEAWIKLNFYFSIFSKFRVWEYLLWPTEMSILRHLPHNMQTNFNYCLIKKKTHCSVILLTVVLPNIKWVQKEPQKTVWILLVSALWCVYFVLYLHFTLIPFTNRMHMEWVSGKHFAY